MKKKCTLALLACLSFCLFVSGQKTIVILGSSTAAGNGASVDSSWAARLQAFYRKNTNDALDTIVNNYGYPGYVTYQTMPSDFVAPPSPDRTSWTPDPLRNVTRAASDHADVVIINLPSNDVNLWPSYNMKETMDNFRMMFQSVMSSGARCYITTTQPRNDMPDDKRLMLRELDDSINNSFGMYAIDFWDDLVTSDGQNMLRTEVNADNIHPNNLGHRLIFERVAAKNIFASPTILPVLIHGFAAQDSAHAIKLQWQAEGAGFNSWFEIERSGNNNLFQFIGRQNAQPGAAIKIYTWADNDPLPGINIYRLKIVEPGAIHYSPSIRIDHSLNSRGILKLYIQSGELFVEAVTGNSGQATVFISSMSGARVLEKSIRCNARTTTMSFPVDQLAEGSYLFTIVMPDGTRATQRFLKGK